MFAQLMKPYAIVQVSLLLQLNRTVVANFIPRKFGLFRRNPWHSLAEPCGFRGTPVENQCIKQFISQDLLELIVKS